MTLATSTNAKSVFAAVNPARQRLTCPGSPAQGLPSAQSHVNDSLQIFSACLFGYVAARVNTKHQAAVIRLDAIDLVNHVAVENIEKPRGLVYVVREEAGRARNKVVHFDVVGERPPE